MSTKIEDDDLKLIGSRLEQLLPKYKTKSAMAKAAGCTTEQLNKWFAGSAKPNLISIRDICQDTNTSADWLLFGTKKIPNEIHLPTMALVFKILWQDGIPETIEADYEYTAKVFLEAYNDVRQAVESGALNDPL